MIHQNLSPIAALSCLPVGTISPAGSAALSEISSSVMRSRVNQYSIMQPTNASSENSVMTSCQRFCTTSFVAAERIQPSIDGITILAIKPFPATAGMLATTESLPR